MTSTHDQRARLFNALRIVLALLVRRRRRRWPWRATGARCRPTSARIDACRSPSRRVVLVLLAPVFTVLGWRVLLADLGSPAAPRAGRRHLLRRPARQVRARLGLERRRAGRDGRAAAHPAPAHRRWSAFARRSRSPSDGLPSSASRRCRCSSPAGDASVAGWVLLLAVPLLARACSGRGCSTGASPRVPAAAAPRAARAPALRPGRASLDLGVVHRRVGVVRVCTSSCSPAAIGADDDPVRPLLVTSSAGSRWRRRRRCSASSCRPGSASATACWLLLLALDALARRPPRWSSSRASSPSPPTSSVAGGRRGLWARSHHLLRIDAT